MKYKFKIDSRGSGNFFELLKRPFFSFRQFLKNLRTSYGLMTSREKSLMFVLFLTSFLLIGYRFEHIFLNQTVAVPKNGGTYTEVMIGEIKYLNPVLTQTDAEKSISKLLFSGLIKISQDGSVVPDLAEKYEISPDGKKYTFYLRKNAKFSDGMPLTAQDVIYTVDSIKAPELKSSLNKSWLDIALTASDDSTVVMELPNAYGPFIYNCDFGILPAGISSDEFSKKVVGSGPFAFEKLIKSENQITELKLKRNDHYYSEKPYLGNINIKVFDDPAKAEELFANDKNVLGYFNSSGLSVGKNFDFQSSKHLGLILNLRSDKLQDKALRQKIIEGGKFDQKIKLGLTTLDAPLQRKKAEEIRSKLMEQNVDVEVFYFNAVKLKDALSAKNYELLLYGFDFGYDRDPYTFWHSSQLEAQNFAGWSDKNTDILLEDARMVSDNQARNLKYDQFFNLIDKEYLIKFYDSVTYSFTIKEKVKGVVPIEGTQANSHFENIAKWFIKEKRVKKAR